MTVEPTTSTEAREAISGLRNLEEGYSLAFAVAFFQRNHGFHVVEQLAAALDENERLREALLRFDLDCMHLHEHAMSDPFGCEAFVQSRIREIITGAKT